MPSLPPDSPFFRQNSPSLRLVLVLALAWIGLGLTGHDLWKPDEATTMVAIRSLLEGAFWGQPLVAGQPLPGYGPLYPVVATLPVLALSDWLSPEDAARITSGIFMALALLTTGLTARELWGRGMGRIVVLLLIGCLGLLVRSHQLLPQVALLAGLAVGLWGLARSLRRPLQGGLLLGLGAWLCLAAHNILYPLLLGLMALLLPLASQTWRQPARIPGFAAGVLGTAPLLLVWPGSLVGAGLLDQWLATQHAALASLASLQDPGRLLFFAGILPWFAWPAWPLAAWAVYQARKTGILRPAVPFGLLGFFLIFAVISGNGEPRDVDALPLLLPLALLAAGALTTLPRQAAAALDWFGAMTFGLLAAYMWLAYTALHTGTPARLADHLARLSPAYLPVFQPLALGLALALTAGWILALRRTPPSHRAITNWAAGITLIWGLASTLAMPYLDAAKSYRSLFGQVSTMLAPAPRCVEAMRLTPEHHSMLEYYTRIVARPVAAPTGACDWLLLRTRRGEAPPMVEGWASVWSGGRRGDRYERLWLLRPLS